MQLSEVKEAAGGPKGVVISFTILGLLSALSVTAQAYPITIAFGRSWPLSVVVDSARGLTYVDATSGEYPPTGFSFGVINSTSHEVIVHPLNVIPGPMALNSASGEVYVAGNKSIEVFNGGNASGGKVIRVGHSILDIVYDGSVSHDIFFTSGNQVFALDPQTGVIGGNATVGGGAGWMALDAGNGRLYVAEYPTGEIFVFDAPSLSRVGIIKLPSCCAGKLAIDTKTRMLYATTGSNFLDIVDVGTNTFEKSVQVSPSSQNSTNELVVDSETGRVYVASSPGGSILEIDGSNGIVVGALKAGSQVAGLALDPKTHELYASNYHQVTVFNATRARILPLILVLAGFAAAVSVVSIYLYLRRRDEKERERVSAGWGQASSPSQSRGH